MIDSDSSEEEGILKKAFDIEMPKNFNPKKAPETGEEYLHHVIYERKQCKKWTRAPIDLTKFQNNQTVYVTAESLLVKPHKKFLPTLQWQLKQQHDFEEFRKFVQHQRGDETTEKEINRYNDWKDKMTETTPSFTSLAYLRQSSLLLLLQVILDNLESFRTPGGGLNDNLCTWLYGILACLEVPLNRDFYYYLRELVKKFAAMRAELGEEAHESAYAPFNLFICVIARVFGQLDLADEDY